MAEHREVDYGQRFPESLLQALQEFVSTYVSPNFKIAKASSSSLKVAAGAGNDEVGVAIDSKWRYVNADVTAAHPGGAAGTYDVYVVASDNSFVASGGTPPETDNTDYTWGLRILVVGGTPTGNHNGKPIAHYRKVGTVAWDGSQITGVTPIIGGVGAHAATHAPAATDGLDYSVVHLRGTLAARPAAAAANASLIYFATDASGGTIYRSTGSAWEQLALGVTQAPTIADGSLTPAKIIGVAVITTDARLSDTRVPQAHQATHIAGGSDALPWTTIHGKGTLAARPVAASANSGYVYYATDANGGTLYRSNGSTWDALTPGQTSTPNAHESTHEAAGTDALPWTTIHGKGTLAARPAAAPTNAGYTYFATDANGGTAYRSDGAAWAQITFGLTAAPNAHAATHLRGSTDEIAWGTVIAIGTLAARPAATGLSGYLYVASDVDSNTLYRSNGSAWFKIAAGVSDSAFAPLASPTFTGTVTLAALTASGIVEIAAAAPSFRMFENDQALDEGMWGLRASSGQLLLETRHDDGTVGTTLMQVLGRVGAGINPNIIDFINAHLRNKGMNVQRHPFSTADRHMESGFAGSMATGGTTSRSITFTDPFAAANAIVVANSGQGVTAWADSVSTTGATLHIWTASSGGADGTWIAEGAD